jgi:hypothetical protein
MFSADPGSNGFFNPQQYSNQNQNSGHSFGQQRRHNNEPQRKSKVFAPVTVRMIMNAQTRPDDVCEFEGEPISDIILLGRLIRRVVEPMRTQFEINDNTGTFFVIFYHKGENQIPTALRNFNYEQFCYAKIYGNIRVFKEEKAIVGSHIKRIEKFDEMTNHHLATYVAHCIRKKGVLKPRELVMETSIDQLPPIQANAPAQQQTGNNESHTTTSESSAVVSARHTILQVMKQMAKTSRFVVKTNVFSIVQSKIDYDTFEKELQAMQDDGVIS